MTYFTNSKYDLYIKKSNIQQAGLGVFTNEYIPANSYIDSYYGEYIEAKYYGGEYFIRINDDLGINAINFPRCYMAMINDACYIPTSKRKLKKWIFHNFINNCKFVINNNKIDVYSTCDININDELFISYGQDYWM